MATRWVYRCATCGDTEPHGDGEVQTAANALPSECRNGHRDAWQVQPVAVRSEADEELLAAIRAARAVKDEADAEVRRLAIRAINREVPLRAVAEAAGVSHQTPANWMNSG